MTVPVKLVCEKCGATHDFKTKTQAIEFLGVTECSFHKIFLDKWHTHIGTFKVFGFGIEENQKKVYTPFHHSTKFKGCECSPITQPTRKEYFEYMRVSKGGKFKIIDKKTGEVFNFRFLKDLFLFLKIGRETARRFQNGLYTETIEYKVINSEFERPRKVFFQREGGKFKIIDKKTGEVFKTTRLNNFLKLVFKVKKFNAMKQFYITGYDEKAEFIEKLLLDNIFENEDFKWEINDIGSEFWEENKK